MLSWLRRFNIFCLLDSHGYEGRGKHYGLLAGAGCRRRFDSGSEAELDAFVQSSRWAFGHFSFSLLHHRFGVPPGPPDPVGFAPMSLFEPEILLRSEGDLLTVEAARPDAVFQQLCESTDVSAGGAAGIPMSARLSREEYLQKIRALLAHIRRGDCYEINFCQEFFNTAAAIDPFAVYQRLSRLSPTPFGAFYRQDNRYLLCASPERFLQKEGDRLLAQPIKGTARRLPDPDDDAALAQVLRNSGKEQAENVMIVDLMRNDLSRVCRTGSVEVPELFGVYTFPQVHQLISSVTGRLETGATFSQILDACFPMGSMTGAPKRRVLELIRQYEPVSRGLYSGSVGYFHEGDFDLNVVIRSLLYNAGTGYLSYQVGSGITTYCDPEAEWEECLVKALAMERALGNDER